MACGRRRTNIVRRYPRAERVLHEAIDLFSTLGCHIAGRGVFIDGELRPDDNMHDLVIYAVRPVVVEYLVICWTTEWRSETGHVIPLQPLLHHESHE